MKKISALLLFTFIFFITGCGRLDYEERKLGLEEIISTYGITETLFYDYQSSYLLSKYHSFNSDDEIVSSRMTIVFGVKGDNLLLLFVPDAIDDLIIEIENPLVLYSLLSNAISDYNQNSESETFVTPSNNTVLTNHIYLVSEYDYNLLDVVNYSLFGSKDDYEGTWSNEIDNYIELLQDSLDAGIILLVGNYYDSEGIDYDVYLSRTLDDEYILFGTNNYYHTYIEITIFSQ